MYKLALIACLLTFGLTACRQQAPVPDYIARVGGRYLTRSELSFALASLPVAQDSLEARQQIVERWVSNELLFQEAMRRGLRNNPNVQRLLQENERSVLISALVNVLYEEALETPTPAEITLYFEQNKEQLRLREPFVRVRYLLTSHPDSAASARKVLLTLNKSPSSDSLWEGLVNRFAVDPEGSRNLARTYYAESRLFTLQPALHEVVARLRQGQTTPVMQKDTLFQVLQLVERVHAGTVPEVGWIEDELRERLLIQNRKQMYARQVQRLRNEAITQENLDIR